MEGVVSGASNGVHEQTECVKEVGGGTGGGQEEDARHSEEEAGGRRKDGEGGGEEKKQQPTHLFWDTQPVPKLQDIVDKHVIGGAIDEEKTPADVRQEPYRLPPGFEWNELDVNNDVELRQVYELLEANYVEDDDNMFRFAYSEPFLLWALTPPEYFSAWHIGVRVTSTKKLVACITGVPATVQIRGKKLDIAEINFLCVYKKLRSKRLAPVLIKEVTRRVNLTNRWQAVYTAGVVLPKPVTAARYWHRSLHPKKLVEVGFSSLSKRLTISRAMRLYKVSDTPELEGIRLMEVADVAPVTQLLSNHLSEYQLRAVLSEDEVRHWLLPRQDVIWTYVRELNGKITDMFSFYLLPSSIIGNDKYKILNAAYSYYNVATSVSLKELMSDALVVAKQKGCDVFNALDVMGNESFLKELKFGVGDGYLRYYVFNWKCPEMAPADVGLVLL
eukprot:GHVS01057234.1.p1 GENE.GHVS01057234.1~~GHVS01057234.1.p1  ORF type:complete len:445 (-),score=79.00 GHVS01057234.1:24-1358(-)